MIWLVLLVEPTKKQEKKIIKLVLKEFKKYHLYVWSLEEKQQPKITASYTLNESTTVNNTFHSSTESTALKNVEACEFTTSLLRKVSRLELTQRQLVIHYYIKKDKSVVQLCNQFHISESQFHRIRNRALMTLAYALGLAREELIDID
ncbi:MULTISPECIES: ArpU family phage packaging/lysis transcriptional regulator [Bacillus]|nr:MULTISPECIES: ArpU family phage packaging/lysis transcriptional regulator [Bacillus cereus group]MDA2067831.1 ArpU family transcriptional regulator [Bacillus cereus]MDA2079578.1 ArpU family transcriptional regulator [Bacillus cereus]MDA2180159.1 ArpU family transcriptional regulator [Bacillus cereus]MDA2497317.1 ArpU family transcriptional regulator [Bacillus cereus]MDG1578466.1 ArpU family phage packaging/lysis transcriptional regulator [Bacillus cereus]